MIESVRIASSAARQQAAAMFIDTVQVSGPALFRALTRRLAEDLALRCCYVGELLEGPPEKVTTHAFWVNGQFAEGVEYPLAGTAGEPAIRELRYYYTGDVLRQFPQDTLAAELKLPGFVAVPLIGGGGAPLGLLAAGLETAASADRPVRLHLELAAARLAIELERVRTERSFAASLHWFKSAIELDATLTFILDSAGQVQYANPIARKVLGQSPDKLVGQSALRFLRPDDHSNLLTFLTALLQRDQPCAVLLCRVQHQNGSCQAFELSGHALAGEATRQVFLIRCHPRNPGSLASGNDPTPHAENLERLGTVAGCVAHDLRNLLAPILAYARTAKGHLPSDHPVQANLDGVVTSALHAGQMANQILDFSRPSRTDSSSYPVISLGRAVADASNLLRVSLPPTVVMRTGIASEPTDCKVDTGQLHQILLNLCLNAAHAMEHETGEIEITVRPFQVDDALRREVAGLSAGPHVLLTVRDNGQGMDEATQRMVFTPFFTTKAPGFGTGLGLVTVRDIVQRHNGSIRVCSQPGGGTTVEIYFPGAAAPPAPAPAPALAALAGALPRAGSRGLDGVRILLVDDEEALLSVLRRMLSRSGADVTACSDPVAALDLLRRETAPFHVVVTDLNMPCINGCEFGRAVRRLDSQVRIIVATGYCSPAAAREIEEIGNATTIDKTAILTDVVREIVAALGLNPADGDLLRS